MAVRLLLDAHVSPVIVGLLRRRGIEATALRDWRGGEYLPQLDSEILAAAAKEGLIVVTFDLGSMPTVLQELAKREISHSGVILISNKTFAQQAFRPIADAIARLLGGSQDLDWQNRVVFLPR